MELLAAIEEGEKLTHDSNAQTYSTPQELWAEQGFYTRIFCIFTKKICPKRPLSHSDIAGIYICRER